MNKLSYAIAGLFVGFLMTSSARAGLIDDFSNTAQLLVRDALGAPTPSEVGPLTDVFGDGYRKLSLNVTEIPDPNDDELFAATQVRLPDGAWVTNNDDQVNSIASVSYRSALGATLLPPSGNASNTEFRATVLTADKDVKLKALFTDSASRTASYQWSNLAAGSVAFALLNAFTFSDPAFDFTQVTGITVEMSRDNAGWDASLGRLETGLQDSNAVPEPSSLLLGLAVTGVVGLVAARRRRKRR